MTLVDDQDAITQLDPMVVEAFVAYQGGVKSLGVVFRGLTCDLL
jgi:hypothetical protein